MCSEISRYKNGAEWRNFYGRFKGKSLSATQAEALITEFENYSLENISWEEKKNLSNLITNNKIDELYNEAINYGALGGKLLGAGGGGFLLMYMKKEKAKKFFRRHKNIINVPFNFTKDGSQVILNNL